ncbi:MAG: phage portal protein [Maricaulis sp.]|jgi:HK97 family phage portal protein|nr:phage portal protein [Maricaulis sp.]
MGIFDNIKNVFSTKKVVKEIKQSPITMFSNINYAQGQKYNYDELVKEGYENNAIAFRCINEISQGAAGVKLKLFRGKLTVDDHPILDLLERPSPTKGYVELFESLYSFLLLSGNSYLIGSGGEGPPKELYCLRPDRVKIVPGQMSLPLSYDYTINGKVVSQYEVDQTTGESAVKHFKLFHPKHDHLGLSPLVSAATNIDSHNLTNIHNVSLLQNGARPSGAVIFKPKDETGSSVQLSDSQRAQIIKDMESRFAGTGNAGRPMLLEGDFSFQQMGMSPKDMDFSVLKKMSAIDIALCFGVPAQLVGIPDAQTYNNMPEARLALYEETIIPILRRIQSDLNEWLTPKFGDGLRLEYDIDSIPAMAESRKRVFESVVSGVNAGILTRNEAREKLGFDPIKGGDALFIPATMMPIGLMGESVDEDEDEKNLELTDDYPVQDDIEENDMPKLNKAIDLKPTDSMANEARKGLEWRREFGRGGTMVGVARARQLANRQNLSPSTVKRMFSFFSRHEVDKRAQGFRPGEKGYPSNGRIAWALWGGDPGFSWARRKVNQIKKDIEEDLEEKQITAAVKEGLKNKVKDHNEKHGDKKGKRVTLRMLSAVFRRGIGAYRTNPQSVRPNVRSEEQWAYARVNAFLFAVRTGRYRSGQFDKDLLPSGHPLKS